MDEPLQHHTSHPVRDVEISAAFHEDIFRLQRLGRPDFGIDGIDPGCGDRQVRLVVNPEGGTFRKRSGADIADVQFAFKTGDFEGRVEKLAAQGFKETLFGRNPKESS